VFASFWHDVINRGRLPVLCCLVALIVTFFATGTIVRYIRHLSERDAPRTWWQPRNVAQRQPEAPGAAA
jgi:predicted metal-dependent hydrolase